MTFRPLPQTPADRLQVSSAPLRAVIRLVTGLAERFGFWSDPMKGAAAEAGEMGALDNLYWIHKTRHPITRAEPGVDAQALAGFDPAQITLPEGFETGASLSFGACGDILRSPGIDGSQDRIYENIAPLLFGQDVAYANFESPVTRQPLVEEVIGDAGPPIECCSPTQFDILASHKGRYFDVLNTTSNHTFDMGVEGVETTQEMLETHGILGTGTQRRPDDYGRARVMERNGIRLGFVSDCFGLNGHKVPDAEAYRIHVSDLLPRRGAPDLSLLERQIADAKAQGCDFIIASVHWGFEFEFFPRARQVHALRALVEAGADAVIAHHPHVIQPLEIYRPERDADRQAVIAYSLGSLTWGFMAPHIALSLVLNLKLAKGRIGGVDKVLIAGAKVTPVVRTHGEEAGQEVTRIEPLADLEAGKAVLGAPDVARLSGHAGLVLGQGWRRGA
ncbi:CapA family protein [Marinibacterium profundimaris]|uniref:Capsule synthesis protein CapA domain-containing protein n=1 Tax=Marinibacterium profundimaris TaxID=1679460 RepID=A0A225NNG7_9RHOB|nr:CapA family protein [Marinibacterium profundimaris]OWU76031.1 hypothetical protein ATO3_07620 [Marinibacterium profundimaris]